MKSDPRELLYPANVLTLLRLVLLAPFIYLLSVDVAWAPAATFVTGLLIGLTDMLDGYVSRKLDHVTELGKAMDPTVDKIVALGAVIGLWLFRGFPLWYVIFKMAKEALLAVRGALVLRRPGALPVANYWGKASAFLLFITCLVFILDVLPSARTYLVLFTAAMDAAALASYYIEHFRRSPPQNTDTRET